MSPKQTDLTIISEGEGSITLFPKQTDLTIISEGGRQYNVVSKTN